MYSSLLEPPTTVVATQNVTENTPPVTVIIRFPIAPTPAPVGLAAVLAPFHPAPEPQVLAGFTFLLRMFDFLIAQMILLPKMLYKHFRTLRDTSTYMNSCEQRLPAEAILTDRQPPLYPL